MSNIKSLLCLAALALAMVVPTAKAAGMPPTGNFVSVRVNGAHIAYGAILTNNRILVPAHVVSGVAPGNYSVLAGSTDRGVTACPTCQLRSVTRIVRHPGYNTSGGYNNDVAILYVSPLTFNATVFGSTVAAPFSNAVGTQFTQVGYENGGTNYNQLQTTASAPWTLATMPGDVHTPGAFVRTTSNTVLHGMLTYNNPNQTQVAMKLSDYAAWINAN